MLIVVTHIDNELSSVATFATEAELKAYRIGWIDAHDHDDIPYHHSVFEIRGGIGFLRPDL